MYVFCRERVANEQFLQPFMQTKETNPMFIYMHCLIIQLLQKFLVFFINLYMSFTSELMMMVPINYSRI